MRFKKILPKLLCAVFLATLALPLSASAEVKDNPDTKATKNQGCKTFSTVKSDICASGLVCEIVNFSDPKFTGTLIASESTNCSTNSTTPTGGKCDGACISVSEQGFGLDASNFGRAGLSQSKDLKGTVARVINIALGFLGIIAVIFILMGGFKIMTAAGNEDQTADGKKAIMGGVIGLVIIFAAWGISSFVINQLQSAIATAPQCDNAHLSLCTTQESCEAAGGDFSSGRCEVSP